MTNNRVFIGEGKTDEDWFWEEIADAAAKNMQKSHDEPAKQIITVSGVLQGLYFVAISFSTLKDQIYLSSINVYVLLFVFLLPIVLWLISLFFAISVIIPKFRTNMYRNSPSAIQKMWNYDIDSKAENLLRAQIFLVAGFLFLVISICVYILVLPTAGHSQFYNNNIINNSGL